MDNQYLILLSLFLMGLIGFVAVVFNDSTLVTSADIASQLRLSGSSGELYDSGGHAVCYYNLTKVAENGYVVFYDLANLKNAAFWRNNTQFFDHQIYATTNGQNPLVKGDFGINGFEPASYMRGFGGASEGFVGSLWMAVMSGAFVAIVVGAVAAAAILSINVLGSGPQEYGTRTVATVGFYSLLWVLVSAVGVSSLTGIPLFGWVFYGLLSFAYYLGVWGEVNN